MTVYENEAAFDYEKSKHMIEDLLKKYPFLSADVVGRTCIGRGIFALSVGNRRNRVLLAGGFHGSEWLTCLVLFRFAERLCSCIEKKETLCSVDVSRAFSELGAVIIPCVNPDGTEIAVHGPQGAGWESIVLAPLSGEPFIFQNLPNISVAIATLFGRVSFYTGRVPKIHSLSEVSL